MKIVIFLYITYKNKKALVKVKRSDYHSTFITVDQ